MEITVRWDRDGEGGASPTETVVRAVAAVTDTSPGDLRPLYEVIDPEGLDALFEPTGCRSERAVNGYVAFRFEGCDVCVHAEGKAVVSLREGDSD